MKIGDEKEFDELKQWAEIESQLEWSRFKVAMSKLEGMKLREQIEHEQRFRSIHNKHAEMLTFYATERLSGTKEFIDKFMDKIKKDSKDVDSLRARVERLEDDVRTEE
jgi:ubiquinone biosynthesis protein UbiJ